MMPEEPTLLLAGVIDAPAISIRPLAKVADRDDFLVRLTHAGNAYEFRLSMTGTIVAIWNIEPEAAARFLVDRLVYSHGTARAFDVVGFWFDSNNSSSTLQDTLNDILNTGWRAFLHPSIRSGLGSHLFGLLDNLDGAFVSSYGQPFVRSLDVLFERSQAGDDFEAEAPDHAHFIYRICLASAIIDRVQFTSDQGSLNGLRTFLVEKLGESEASSLTETFYMIKKLRKQYPIHEEYEVGGNGNRSRRRELEQAEAFFGLGQDPAADWAKVRTVFVGALEKLLEAVSSEDAA